MAPFYAKGGMPVIFLLTGAFGFLIGFGVFLLRAEDRRARLFFWLCMAFSSAVMISGEWYGVQGRPERLVPGVLFFFAYTLTPVLLLKFVRTFTARERPRGEPFLWAAALLFGGFFSAIVVAALLVPSIAIFRLKIYFSIFRLFFAVVCIASAVILFRAFRCAPSRERRDQIRWVLYGLIAGLGPFMFLYSLPRAFGSSSPLSEEAASGFFVLLPLALAFAILKYRLLNIRVIINRSVVYSLLTAVTVGVYLLSIEGLKTLLRRPPRSGSRSDRRSSRPWSSPRPGPGSRSSSTGPSSGRATTTAGPSSASRRRPGRPTALPTSWRSSPGRSTRRCPWRR